ncbi:unnamed protein product [Prorocentrum cordatum]|uniref:Serine/threonine specific protein phosphatases domain-containing protein n=1 Tax=Prorocentrum cordatum TaxID=2364126 RepID=A0ABN9WVF2_9DINO|nr:unnamed protein product [Polarella glacialis]
MWSDPQEENGVRQNPRGSGLVTFGPDWTHRFLADTGMSIIVRSHQVPPNNDGFYQHHGGRLLTVFSASNYCGVAGNQGAVLIYRPGQPLEAVRHWAPDFRQIAEVVIDTPEVGPAAEAVPEAARAQRRQQRKSTASSMEVLAKGGDAKAARTERLEKQGHEGPEVALETGHEGPEVTLEMA